MASGTRGLAPSSFFLAPRGCTPFLCPGAGNHLESVLPQAPPPFEASPPVSGDRGLDWSAVAEALAALEGGGNQQQRPG